MYIPFNWRPTKPISAAVVPPDGEIYRDPSNIVFFGGKYHVYYTHFVRGEGEHIGHASGTTVFNLTHQGDVIAPGTGGTWNDKGVITPQVVIDTGHVWIFATGIPHSGVIVPFQEGEQIGHWSATDADGPFTPGPGNPIVGTDPSHFMWHSALADEAMPLNVNGQRRLYFKGRRRVAPFDVHWGYATNETNTWAATNWTIANGGRSMLGSIGIDSMSLFTLGGVDIGGFGDSRQRELLSGQVNVFFISNNKVFNVGFLDTHPSSFVKDTTGVGLWQPSPLQPPGALVYHVHKQNGDYALAISPIQAL